MARKNYNVVYMSKGSYKKLILIRTRIEQVIQKEISIPRVIEYVVMTHPANVPVNTPIPKLEESDYAEWFGE